MQRIVDEVSFDSVHDGRDNGALSHKPAFVHDLPQMHLKKTRDKTTVHEAEYISVIIKKYNFCKSFQEICAYHFRSKTHAALHKSN
jgi:hypothetical protein